MSQSTASLHEALPRTFDTKNAAIIAIRRDAKRTGHKVVLPNHGSTNITFRCRGYKESECAFKVSVFRPTVGGIRQTFWVLNHDDQTWQHTCRLATGAASSRPIAESQGTLTPAIPRASAASAGIPMPQSQGDQSQRVSQLFVQHGATPQRTIDAPARKYLPPGLHASLVGAGMALQPYPAMPELHCSAPVAAAMPMPQPQTRQAQGVSQQRLQRGANPRPVSEAPATEYVPLGMQATGMTMQPHVSAHCSVPVVTANMLVSQPQADPQTQDTALQLVEQPPPVQSLNILRDGKPECPFCIAGSGKVQGHYGRHKEYVSAKASRQNRKKQKALKQQHSRANQLIVLPSTELTCVAAAQSSPEAEKLQEAIQLLPTRFKDRRSATEAIRRFETATGMRTKQVAGQNSYRVIFRCVNCETADCGFRLFVYRPMRDSNYEEHWLLNHRKCTWVHALTCYSASTPRALEVAKIPAVRGHIQPYQTLGAAKENLDVIRRFFDSQGIQIPRQSGDRTLEGANDLQRRFCLRVCARVLGYDNDGLDRSLRKLDPWCKAFRDGGNGDAHLEIRDGEFVAVVITWHTSTHIVVECGFRLVALDAATFEYMRKDLRLFIIVGYTSNNTLIPLAMMITFDEDVHTYKFFFRTLKNFPRTTRAGTELSAAHAGTVFNLLWSFLDDERTSIVADQGPLRCTRTAFKAVFEKAELRSCSRHILENCRKRAQALDSDDLGLLDDLAKCPNELGVHALLDQIKLRSLRLYEYILKDDHYTHWVRLYLRDTFDGGKHTSNAAEQFFSASKRKGFRRLLPLDCVMEITKYTGGVQQEFYNLAGRRLREFGSGAMTKYVDEQYGREKQRAKHLHMVGSVKSQPFNVDHLVSCIDGHLSQGYSSKEINPHAGYVVPTTVTVRFESHPTGSIAVTCSSVRCDTWTAKGYACRHACVVGAHQFPAPYGKLIDRDGGTWWLRHMVRREFRCQTIRNVETVAAPTTSPPMPHDTAAGPPIQLPVLRSDNRADRKPGRYRAARESSDKGRAPPKRKERDSVAEAAQDLVLSLDESDCCLAVVYNQTTKAKFADGSPTTGRARPVRVKNAGLTSEPQPRLIATVHCFLTEHQNRILPQQPENAEKHFLIEHISFAALITDHVARNDACTGRWWHPAEPARHRAQSASAAAAAAAANVEQIVTPNPTTAQELISEAEFGTFFMVVYQQQGRPTKPNKKTRVTTYADGSSTDSVRPRPIRLLARWEATVDAPLIVPVVSLRAPAVRT